MKNALIVAPFRQMEPFYRRELKKRGLDIDIISVIRRQDQSYTKSILTRVEEQVASGKEIVITRGTLANEIRRRFPQIQVVELDITDLDVLETMQKYVGSEQTVAAVECSAFVHKVERVGKLLGIPVAGYIAGSIAELQEKILEAAKEGYRVIISGGWGQYDNQNLRLLAPYSVAYEMVACSGEAVTASIERALDVCQAIQVEKQQKEMLHTIIDFSPNGLIAVDSAGRITLYNSSARRMLGLDDLSQGQPISRVMPELHLEETVKSGQEERNRVIKSRELVVTNIPLRAGKEVLGAISTFQKIQDIEESGRRMRSQLAQKGLTAHYTFDDLIGESHSLGQTKKLARTFCQLDSTILITGETGTGKEILAQSIHNASPRQGEPFVAVNCSALPGSLLESELFGYVDGAFTGARRGGSAGLFELAHKGTIFLDEIGEIDKRMQALLLRVLQEKEVRRVGGEKVIPIDVRVIAATNQDLYEAVLDGKFRNDLYFRLSILNIHLPALRKRREDIPLLVESLIGELDRRLGCRVSGVDGEILQVLREYNWPGNVRELRNTLEKIVALTREGVARREAIIPVLQDLYYRQQKHESRAHGGQTIEELERRAIAEALLEENGNRTRAARRLGMDRSTLLRKIERYGIKG